MKPAGYTKAKAQRTEYSKPRQPLHAGRPKVCQGCYRNHPTFIDHICHRCLRDLNDLAKLQEEIVAALPKTRKLKMPALFRSLWEGYRRLKEQAS